ncbi:MAG: alpha/beta hydrolase [Rhodococcus sp. (in: high G+C Gram-positive bacteria)]
MSPTNFVGVPSRVARYIVAVLAFVAVGMSGVASAQAAEEPTVVLVHGAFADSTGWRDVTTQLTAQGYPVQTFDNPLRGPRYDANQLQRQLDTIAGPIVLVGHSYGGAVITNTYDPDVVANVFVAAFAPDQGELVQGLLNPITFPGSRLLPPALQLTAVDDPTGTGIAGKNVDGFIAEPYFHDTFAQDVGPSVAADMFAHQKSAALVANLEPSGAPSWRTVPSWYLVSQQDRVIPASLQRFMASRAAAGNITEIDSSHASLVSHPADVTVVIVAAAHTGG